MLTTRRSLLAALVLALGAVAACGESAPVAPDMSSDASLQVTSVTTPSSGPFARIVEGRTGPASLYAIHVPREWNGDAVMYAHGFRDVATPVDLRDQDQLLELTNALGELGYAVAYSSFDANGFVVKNGA